MNSIIMSQLSSGKLMSRINIGILIGFSLIYLKGIVYPLKSIETRLIGSRAVEIKEAVFEVRLKC